ncbi:unnamed protein product [marine sediment metagenome]|uniref:FAD/NAD(P)-binding domain-containing protein n=1 Tax=marine sediment metagenome TaxID=412755 RepID=X0Z915_9ZZZZ
MHDLIIIGAGPAGITAGIYAGRYKLNILILTQTIGGTANEAFKIENFPGFESISGVKLMKKFKESLDYLKVPVITGVEVEKIKKFKDGFEVFTNDGKKHRTKTLILAIGTQVRKLGLHNEKKFLGRGLTYCATCDAPLFKDRNGLTLWLFLCLWPQKHTHVSAGQHYKQRKEQGHFGRRFCLLNKLWIYPLRLIANQLLFVLGHQISERRFELYCRRKQDKTFPVF